MRVNHFFSSLRLNIFWHHIEVLLFTFLDGTFEREAISEFLSTNKLPLVVIFNHETTSAIFEDEASRQVIIVIPCHDLV